MGISEMQPQCSTSYSDWMPSRQTLARVGVAAAGTTILGLAYLWGVNSEQHSCELENPCTISQPSEMGSATYSGMQTVANIAIYVFSGMGLMAVLGFAAHVDREQANRQSVVTDLEPEISESSVIRDLEPEISKTPVATDPKPEISEIPEIRRAKFRHDVIFLPRLLWKPEYKSDLSAFQTCWQSQFLLVEHLLLYPNTAVFLEDLPDQAAIDNGSFKEIAQKIFPNGLPAKMDSWTESQRSFLAEMGAPMVLHSLGIIDSPHRSTESVMDTELGRSIEWASRGKAFRYMRPREMNPSVLATILPKNVRDFFKKPENEDCETSPVYVYSGSAYKIAGIRDPELKISESPEIQPAEPTYRRHQIIHIPQVHWVPKYKNDPTFIARCWESQFRVLQQLLHYPNPAVFVEGIMETSHHYNGIWKKVARVIFPNGLPGKMESWTDLQREFLAEKGAPEVLHFLGIIDSLYRSIDPITGKKIDSVIGKAISTGRSLLEPGLKELVFDMREAILAKEVREFLKQPENKDRQVLIVYGSAHELVNQFPAESFIRLAN